MREQKNMSEMARHQLAKVGGGATELYREPDWVRFGGPGAREAWRARIARMEAGLPVNEGPPELYR